MAHMDMGAVKMGKHVQEARTSMQLHSQQLLTDSKLKVSSHSLLL